MIVSIEKEILFIIAGIIYIFLTFFLLYKKVGWGNYFLYTIFYIYLIILIKISYFPIELYDQILLDDIKKNNLDYLQSQFIPFQTIFENLKYPYRNLGIDQFFGNILLLVPAGFFVPLVYKKIQKLQFIILIGALISITIEVIGFILTVYVGHSYKVFDIDDIILNTLGFLLGFGIYKIGEKIYKKYHEK